jgi:hypothetical protein
LRCYPNGNKTSDQQNAKAMIFIRRHLHEGLKNEYLTVKDPLVLWNKLKERYEHKKNNNSSNSSLQLDTLAVARF